MSKPHRRQAVLPPHQEPLWLPPKEEPPLSSAPEPEGCPSPPAQPSHAVASSPRAFLKRYQIDAAGTPLGRGGDPCPDCANAHVSGEACDPDGLIAVGWIRNGRHRDGRPRWLKPRTAAKRARKARSDRSLKVHVPEVLKSFGEEVAIGPSRRRVSEALAKAGPPPKNAFAQKLDPQTYRAWLTIAKGRSAGLVAVQIARALECEESLIEDIVDSPTYLHFESVFRQVMSAGSDMAMHQDRLMALLPKALDALEYWVTQRDPALWAASMAAAKTIAAGTGIDTERKRNVNVNVRADLSSRQSDRLIDAISRDGA